MIRQWIRKDRNASKLYKQLMAVVYVSSPNYRLYLEIPWLWSILNAGVIEMKRIDILLLLIVLAFSPISVKNKVWAWMEMEIMLEKKKEAKSNKNSKHLLEVFLMAQSNQAIRYRTCPKPPSSTPICVNRDWVFHQRLFAMTASKSLFMLMMFRSTV